MAYTPTTWQTGDKVTAAKLNNIENGIVKNEEDIAELAANIAADVATNVEILNALYS